jgi:DNA-binding transcriptional LysR family regulator
MIDRYQLRYFLAVVEQGNFTRAAAQCNVSQPTLSVGIAKLEREVESKLFIRDNRRVQLTPAGTRFLTHARRIENEFNLAQLPASGGTQRPLLRLGVLRSIPGARLAVAMSVMLRLDSAARIEILEGSERELSAYLARGRIDCALTLVGRGKDRFLEEAVFEEGYSLVMPLSHSCADQEVVKAEALGDDVMILRRHCEVLADTSRHFTDRGVRPHFAFRSFNDERVLQLVGSGLGITLMPDSYAAAGIARPVLAGFNLRRTIGLAYGARAEMMAVSPPPAIEALRQELSVR